MDVLGSYPEPVPSTHGKIGSYVVWSGKRSIIAEKLGPDLPTGACVPVDLIGSDGSPTVLVLVNHLGPPQIHLSGVGERATVGSIGDQRHCLHSTCWWVDHRGQAPSNRVE